MLFSILTLWERFGTCLIYFYYLFETSEALLFFFISPYTLHLTCLYYTYTHQFDTFLFLHMITILCIHYTIHSSIWVLTYSKTLLIKFFRHNTSLPKKKTELLNKHTTSGFIHKLGTSKSTLNIFLKSLSHFQSSDYTS